MFLLFIQYTKTFKICKLTKKDIDQLNMKSKSLIVLKFYITVLAITCYQIYTLITGILFFIR